MYIRAVDKWGFLAQLNMVVEECAELIHAIQKMKRGEDNYIAVTEEAVDVEIMLGQLRYMVDNDNCWSEIRTMKLERLEERLKKGGG